VRALELHWKSTSLSRSVTDFCRKCFSAVRCDAVAQTKSSRLAGAKSKLNRQRTPERSGGYVRVQGAARRGQLWWEIDVYWLDGPVRVALTFTLPTDGVSRQACPRPTAGHRDPCPGALRPSVHPSVLPRSIAPWPLFGRNTNGRLRSTRIDWLLPSGECIVVTYASRRRAFSSPPGRDAGRAPRQASLGRTRDPPSTIDATERRWLDTISGGARQTNVRRSYHVRLSTPSGTQAGLGGWKDERATDWLIGRALNRAPDLVADRPLASSWSSLADWVTEQVRAVTK